jgi:hypothetical protein
MQQNSGINTTFGKRINPELWQPDLCHPDLYYFVFRPFCRRCRTAGVSSLCSTGLVKSCFRAI